MFNRTTLYILIAALAAGLGLWAGQAVLDHKAPTEQPETQAVRLLPQPRELPAYSLRQSDRTQLVPGELKGHWTVVFLGFTHCPDVCPTTLAELAQAQKQWADLPDPVRPRVLFVSVDPERDTPDRTGEYAHAFHRDTLAATADVPTLERFVGSIGLVFAKVPSHDEAAPDAYSIEHSGALVVLDPQARMAGLVQPPFDALAIADDLTHLTKTQR